MSFVNKLIKTFTIVSLLGGTLLPVYAWADDSATSMEGFKDLKVAPGLAQADHFIDTIRPFLLNHPENEEGNASMNVNIRKVENSYLVDIIKTGYLDDSVKGEHFRGYVIKTSAGPWELLSLGVKYLCYRGTSASGICN